MMKKLKLLVCLASVVLWATSSFAYVTGTPVPTDSRIKTFVYNANDVYRVLTHYGYQMNLEFGEEEEIETISVGDRSGWQITPDENRIFVRAMEDKAHTNMTVITSERTYQFDLYSAQPGQQGWDELVYVVRFYYPSDSPNQFVSAPQQARPMMAAYPTAPMPQPMMPQMAPQMMMPAPMLQPMMPQMAPQMPSMSMLPALPALPPLSAPAFSSMAQLPPMFGSMAPQPSIAMQRPQLPQMPMGQPLYSPALPPVSAPPMASPQMMMRPATPVPPVNVARKPFGMIVPPHVAVAPPPKMPHPRAPFIVNEMGKPAQQLAREYPQGSYRNPLLAPRRLPSLDRFMKPSAADEFSSSSSMNVSPMGLPLPSAAPGGYIQF
ncbi:MAG: TrbG/VirB9 family P-type conjugative transfer protein [Rickettsiales bacterium]|nr:TrbG/VirB9 family P-type conjugative transfer protein [Rickettsiales bacterium]